MKVKFRLAVKIILVVILGIGAYSCSTKKPDKDSIFGIYRIYSDDPIVKMYIAKQDTYLQVNDDNTIAYKTTINGKPKFNFSGKYTLDQTNKTLNIGWRGGKLPKQLKVEQNGKYRFIKIGETIYLKDTVETI